MFRCAGTGRVNCLLACLLVVCCRSRSAPIRRSRPEILQMLPMSGSPSPLTIANLKNPSLAPASTFPHGHATSQRSLCQLHHTNFASDH
uniref:Putative secreted protein n=1 Tax=Anopheles darlingi TaxID=43151 RepID=A0A2M4DIY3_ANODA